MWCWSALEAKGERGVLSGIRQVIEKLLQRFSKGLPVVTEHLNFTMGKDLFLSIEDAARSLNVSPTKARELAAAVRPGLDRYRAFVVSPLPEKVALETYKANFGPQAKAADKITYLEHPIPRSSMVAIVQGLASVFCLDPHRRSGPFPSQQPKALPSIAASVSCARHAAVGRTARTAAFWDVSSLLLWQGAQGALPHVQGRSVGRSGHAIPADHA